MKTRMFLNKAYGNNYMLLRKIGTKYYAARLQGEGKPACSHLFTHELLESGPRPATETSKH